MKKIISLFFAIIFCTTAFSQTAFKRYYIQFTNKNNSPYSISNPSAYLSARAILRRTNQHIPIDSLDLPVNPAYLDSVVFKGAIIVNPTKWLNGVTVATSDTNVLLAIEQLSFVQKLNPVSIVNAAKIHYKKNINYITRTNSKIISARSTSSTYNYGSALTQIEIINGIGLHQAGYQGQGMVIASLDDGYDNANVLSCFDSLRNDNRLLGWKDFVSLNNSDMFQLDTHGSMTLSDMAAFLPGQMIGTAPKSGYWLLRSENDSTENPIELYNWVSAAEFADSVGADIITSSLGYSTFDDAAFNYTYADMNGKTTPCAIAAGIAASKGMIVCNSAGNDGNSSWHYITTPGDADSIITVGSVDQYGNYASTSGHGPTSDGRIKPDVVALGDGAAIINPTDGTTSLGYGTSFSCPIIAGMTACLWQEYPTKTNKEIIQAIKQSASLYSNPDNTLGYGIPNYGLASVILGLASDNTPINQSNVPYVFPNPFSDALDLIYFNNTTDDENIQLFDMLGRLVYYKTITSSGRGFHNYTLNDLNLLSKGVYVMVVSTATQQQMIKIVKM